MRGLLGVGTAMLILALPPACTSDEPSTPKADKPAATPESFARPKRVRPPRVKDNLTVEHIRGCLYPERIDISTLAGVYTGPVDFVADQVSESRELDFATPGNVDFLAPASFRRDYGTNPPTGREDLLTTWLSWGLGLMPYGIDVNYFLGSDSSDLVAGFYSSKSKRVVVRRKGELDAEYTVLAHEVAHAAVDEVLGLPKKEHAHFVDDEALARDALVEGDATLVEFRFASRFSSPKNLVAGIKDLLHYEKDYEGARRSGVPYMLIDKFVFPYRWGVAFVCSVFQKRGWSGIDRMYSHPPVTTAEIMFPDRYLTRDKPQRPPRLGKPPRPYRLYAKGSIGAFHLKAMFEAPGDVERRSLGRAVARTLAWDGGHYEVWATPTSESLVGLSLVEHKKHRGLLCSSMNAWYQTAFVDVKAELVADRTLEYSGDELQAVIACAGRNVRVGVAPTMELARAVVD